MRNLIWKFNDAIGRVRGQMRWWRLRWSRVGRAKRWLIGTGTVFGCATLFFASIIVWYAHDLPDVEGLKSPDRRPSVTITASDGSLIATYGDLFAGPLRVEDVPTTLIEAIIATEDRKFFKHVGFDPMAVLRAAYVNLKSGSVRQGGSTITQQLAKNLFLSSERTLRRKVQELILAFWLEAKFTKHEIFAIYVNRLYLGAGTFGMAAAAKRYFGLDLSELSLHETAVLAGLIQAPSRYAPSHNPEAAINRAKKVLSSMVAEKYLTREQADEAALEPLRLVRKGDPGGARYFTDWVLGRAKAYIGLAQTDLVIRTTLDPVHQKAAIVGLTATLARTRTPNGMAEGALIAMSPDGAVRAMVGGGSYRKSQFNRATQAKRQPGSVFKLFVYLAGLEAGLSPSDTFTDEPVEVDKWKPSNYGGKYFGTVTLTQAFARSLNSVAVQVSERAGRDKVAEAAHRLGITAPLTPHPSLALGTSEVTLLELTGAYAVVANGGKALIPHGILEIRDSYGTVLFAHEPPEEKRLIAGDDVDDLRDMLAAVVIEGTGKRAAIGRPMAGKTGTSQDFRDAWFVGFTPGLVAGVWIGNDDGSPMDRVVGGSLPAIVWRDFVTAAPTGTRTAFAREGRWSFFSRVADAFGGLFGSSSTETRRTGAPGIPGRSSPNAPVRKKVDTQIDEEEDNHQLDQ